MTARLGLLDAEINQIASLCSWTFDEERRDVLRSGNSCDVRACAGSGKTTLLVAKLAGLTSRWTHQHRGICVISHTNVARKEIERQFPKWGKLQALNHYPHFVGTIQSFVNQFLAINSVVELTGRRPNCLDDDQYAFEIERRFTAWGPYASAFAYITKHLKATPEKSPQVFVAQNLRYTYSAGALKLAPVFSTKLSESTPTYKQLLALKQTLTKDGCFCYTDTTALSLMYIDRYPRLREALCKRFPIVLVDEAQDTVAQQAALLDRLFLGGSVLQRFGDDRQAILSNSFTEDAPGIFPRASDSGVPILPIKRSLRLSSSIARLVTAISHGEKEELGGDPNTPTHSHSIFLFSKSSIGQVLPSFCELVQTELGGNSDPKLVKAVGFSTIPRGPEALPSAVSDYWDGFQSRHEKSASIRCFADGLLQMGDALNNGDGIRNALTALLSVFAKSLAIQGIKNESVAFTPTTLLRVLRDKHPESERLLRRTLVRIVGDGRKGLSLDSSELASLLGETVQCLGWTHWNQKATQFIQNPPLHANTPLAGASKPKAGNVFEWTKGADLIRVGLGTIHSIKGETLRATLVLETKYRQHDLHTMVKKGYLTGSNGKKAPAVTELKFLRTTYVAMSRPTHLLCLALLADHVPSKAREELQNAGWSIQEL